MEKLLMLGTTPTSVELVNMAKARGVYTITTDYFEPEKSQAKLVSDEYWMISTADVDLLEKKCREEGVTAILTGLSEFNAIRMAELCQRLGLPCWCTPESWNAVQQKHNFKRYCRENGVPVATDYFLSNPPTEEELAEIVFPVVVKAVDLNSNIGMSYCYNKEDVVRGCELARSLSSNETVIVERMLQGREYTAYYALADGEASLLSLAAMFSQPGYPGNCYSVTATDKQNLQRYLRDFDPNIRKMLRAAGCREGICWIEMFLDEDGVFYPIEMGYRLSGDRMHIPHAAVCGFDSLEWLLDVALGKKHTAEDLPVSARYADGDKCACSYILWSKSEGVVSRLTGTGEIAAIPGMHLSFESAEGVDFELYQYMVIFAFAADDCGHMIELLDKINRTVKILDQDGNNAVIYFDDFAAVRELAGGV